MAEGHKSFLSMISAHPTGSYTSKREVWVGEMKNGVVDAPSAIEQGVHHTLFILLVLSEEVEG